MATIVCDVNETLLDLSGLDEVFACHVGERAAEVKRLWFARLVHTSVVLTTLGTWQDFGVVGRAVLADLSERFQLGLDDAAVAEVVGAMTSLPAHPDVVPGIEALRRAGHRVVALTNSGQATAEAQLAHAGLDSLLEMILSVDATASFKPAREVYVHAQEQLEVPTSELVMVAVHDWDCAGAMKAGWSAAFLRRPGQAYNPLLQPPTWEAPDLVVLASQLAAAGGSV